MKNLLISFLVVLQALALTLPALAWNSKNFDAAAKNKALQKLSEKQRYVTRQAGTEAPFQNEYVNNHEAGIYVDVVSGEPLFSSLDKFDSGTGWPSFTKPIDTGNIVIQQDKSHFTERTEVKSRHGDSHLGHVFDDGPGPGGKRFCMNSASLRFIPVNQMAKEGYGEYIHLFKKDSKSTVKPMTQ